MLVGVLSRWFAGIAAVTLAAPVAQACERPDDIRVALRIYPPAIQEPGEVVLELDPASMVMVKVREDVFELDQDAQASPKKDYMTFDVVYATFDVTRVIGGDFADKQARISATLTSTCSRIGAPGAHFLVGRPETDDDGIPYIVPRGLTWSELRTQRDQDQKTAH